MSAWRNPKGEKVFCIWTEISPILEILCASALFLVDLTESVFLLDFPGMGAFFAC